jgi:hypothetical protein
MLMGSEPKPAGLAFMWQITAAPTDREILDPRFELGAGVGFKREECTFDSSDKDAGVAAPIRSMTLNRNGPVTNRQPPPPLATGGLFLKNRFFRE